MREETGAARATGPATVPGDVAAPLGPQDPCRLGDYRLTGRLGVGGMGVVYLGRGPDGRLAAVKLLHPWLATDPEAAARFRRETQILMRVGGICTARVVDVDVHEGRPYVACEYVPGPTLSGYLDRFGPLTGEALHGFAVGLAEALVAIHDAEVVHRDLSPTNVLLSADGPKVVDFGIARHADIATVTSSQVVVGTPGWMAPEQVRGAPADPAGDVFAWGALVAYAAAGSPPFGTGPSEAVLYRIVHEDPTVPELPAPLDRQVRQALRKDPAQRPRADRLVDELLAGTGDDVTQVLARTWRLPVRALEDATTVVAVRSGTAPRRRWPFAAIAVLTLALGLATGAAVTTILPDPPERLAAPPTDTAAQGAITEPVEAPEPAEATGGQAQAAAKNRDAADEKDGEPELLTGSGAGTESTGSDVPESGPRTERRLMNPWEGGELRTDVTLTDRVDGECWSGSTILSGRRDAWRCSTVDSQIHDPCFSAAGDHGTVACPRGADDLTDEVVLLEHVDPLPWDHANEDDVDPDLPWALEFADGERCRQLGGATTVIADMRLNYGCDDGEVYGENQGTDDAWSVFYQPAGSSEIAERAVAVIWR